MNIYYEIENAEEEGSFRYEHKYIRFYLDELLNSDFDDKFLEYSYNAFELLHIDSVEKHYLSSSNWESEKKYLWSKCFVLYENQKDFDFWISFLKEQVEKINVTKFNSLEFLAKIKFFTSYFMETEKSGYECFSLDAEYGLMFDKNVNELKLQFQINSWEFKIDSDKEFKIFVSCQFLIDDTDKIDFVVLIVSFKKLVEEFKKNKFLPLVYIMSTTFEKDLLSKYIEHTFSSFKASSIEELNYKIATFAHNFKFDIIKKNHNGINFKLEKRIN